MKKQLYILLLAVVSFLPPTYLDWGTGMPTGLEVINGGQGIRRSGIGSTNALNRTASNVFQPTDTLYMVINAPGAGAYNIGGLSDQLPITTDTAAQINANTHLKYAFYHGNESGSGTLYLRTIENGATHSYSETLNGNYYLRIIYDPGAMIYQKSTTGAVGSYTNYRISDNVPTGNFYPVVQLQNPGTFSSFNQFYISKGPGISTENTNAIKWY